MIRMSGICGIIEISGMNSASAINDVEFTKGGGASKCPDVSETLSGCFRNWCPDVSEMLSGCFRNCCPDVSEISIRNCLITEQTAKSLCLPLSKIAVIRKSRITEQTANAVRTQLSKMRLELAEGGGADE